MRSLRRRILRLLLASGAGVIITIAVAWGLSAWVDWREPAVAGGHLVPHGGRVAAVLVWEAQQAGAARRSIATWDEMEADWGGRGQNDMPEGNLPATLDDQGTLDQTWGHLAEALAAPDRTVRAVEEARGWPWLAAWCWHDAPGSQGSAADYHGALAWDRPGEPPTVLPRLPIWPGVALDSALYGSLVLIGMIVPGLVRARIRARGGRCPECGYDLGATGGAAVGCPECGWRRADAGAPSGG